MYPWAPRKAPAKAAVGLALGEPALKEKEGQRKGERGSDQIRDASVRGT